MILKIKIIVFIRKNNKILFCVEQYEGALYLVQAYWFLNYFLERGRKQAIQLLLKMITAIVLKTFPRKETFPSIFLSIDLL